MLGSGPPLPPRQNSAGPPWPISWIRACAVQVGTQLIGASTVPAHSGVQVGLRLIKTNNTSEILLDWANVEQSRQISMWEIGPFGLWIIQEFRLSIFGLTETHLYSDPRPEMFCSPIYNSGSECTLLDEKLNWGITPCPANIDVVCVPFDFSRSSHTGENARFSWLSEHGKNRRKKNRKFLRHRSSRAGDTATPDTPFAFTIFLPQKWDSSPFVLHTFISELSIVSGLWFFIDSRCISGKFTCRFKCWSACKSSRANTAVSCISFQSLQKSRGTSHPLKVLRFQRKGELASKHERERVWHCSTHIYIDFLGLQLAFLDA